MSINHAVFSVFCAISLFCSSAFAAEELRETESSFREKIECGGYPVLSLEVDGSSEKASVIPGQNVTIRWQTQDFSDCTLWPVGEKGLEGSYVVENISRAVSYTLECLAEGAEETEFRTTKTIPIELGSIPAELEVSRFNATAGDGLDDGPAIREALRIAKLHAIKVLRFSPGVYDIHPESETDTAHLKVEGQVNLTLVGEHAELVFHDLSKAGISFERNSSPPANINGRAVELRGLSFDYAKVPYAYGIIKSLGDDSFRFEHRFGLSLDDPAFASAQQSFAYIAANDGHKALYRYFVVSIETSCSDWALADEENASLFDIKPSACSYDGFPLTNFQNHSTFSSAGFKEGLPLAILARNYKSNLLSFTYNTGGLIVDGVSIYSSPGLATFWGENKGWVIFKNSKIQPKNESYPLSTNADGVHVSGHRGQFIIQNNHFEGMADDAIAFSVKGVELGKELRAGCPIGVLHSPDNISFTKIGTNNYLPGDSIVFGNKVLGAIAHKSKVEGVTYSVKTCSDGLRYGQYRVTLAQSLPKEVLSQWGELVVFNETQSVQGSRIEQNTFGPLRGRAVNTRSQYLNIINNRAYQVQSYFAAIETNFEWVTGPFPKYINIKNNVIEVADSLDNDQAIPMIKASVYGFDDRVKYTNEHSIDHIQIRGNTVINPKTTAVELRNVRVAEVSENQIVFSDASIISEPKVLDLISCDDASIRQVNNSVVRE